MFPDIQDCCKKIKQQISENSPFMFIWDNLCWQLGIYFSRLLVHIYIRTYVILKNILVTII